MNNSPFRNQRARFLNVSRPYADKPAWSGTRSSTEPRGALPSRKNGMLVRFWTKQEYDAAILFEAFPAVSSYRERPFRLMLRDGPRWHAYVPHFSVTLQDGRQIAVELSADGRPRGERQCIVEDLVRRRFAAEGIQLVGLAHWMVRSRPRSTDAIKLTQPLLLQPDAADLHRAQDALDAGPTTLQQLATRSGVPTSRLLAMVRNRTLHLRGGGPIDGATLLVRPGQDGDAS